MLICHAHAAGLLACCGREEGFYDFAGKTPATGDGGIPQGQAASPCWAEVLLPPTSSPALRTTSHWYLNMHNDPEKAGGITLPCCSQIHPNDWTTRQYDNCAR